MLSLLSRRQALLLAAAAVVPSAGRADPAAPASLDGTYVGSFAGEATGTLTFTVENRQLSGSLKGVVKNDPIEATFSGAIGEDGSVAMPLAGTVRDTSRFNLGTFPFSGAVNGRIAGETCSGGWTGANQFARHAGTWSASRK
ncbi:hypothetical protein [Blastochloris sulfoviridis]|uniref:Uncharacterized protein n=1 Tax=Blastochloris sulfoviridis TaxID=50712 RepID=A0A5M6I2J2_9HYPH|nr:hypothetical protein [Blastochloris sulfoviridis]KAA5602089.1 hypothetical protein F1193_06890 [Blastochloris sulfoviridis]